MEKIYYVEKKVKGKWRLVEFSKEDESDGWHTYHTKETDACFIARQMCQNIYMRTDNDVRVKFKLVSNEFFNKIKRQEPK